MRPPRSVSWIVLALGVAVLSGSCGKGDSTGPGGRGGQFLREHNARFADGKTVRFPDLPIPVFANGIARADELAAWTAASEGRVTFAIVGSPQSQGINVRYRSGTDICGSTTVEYDGDAGVIVSADIRVSEAIFRGPQCVRTITHEVGHGIGMLDHTSDGGLMDDDGGNGEITPAVANMMRDLYSLPPGTEVGLPERPRTTALRRSGGRYTVTFVHPVRP